MPDGRRGTPSPVSPPTLRSLGAAILLATLAHPCLAAWTAGGVAVAAFPGNQSAPLAVPDGAGGILIAWLDDRPGVGGLYLNRLTPDGDIGPSWAAGGLRVASESLMPPALVPDGAGGAFLMWMPTDIMSFQLQHIGPDAQVVAGWPPGGISFGPVYSGNVTPPVCAPDDSGGILLGYHEQFTPTSGRTIARRVNGSGSTVWVNELLTSFFDSWPPASAIVSDQAGGAYLATKRDTTGGSNLYVQRVDSTGAITAGWGTRGFPITLGGPTYSDPLLISDAGKGVMVVWECVGTPPGFDQVFADRIRPDGAMAWFPWGTIGVQLTDGTSEEHAPLAVTDGTGGAIVAWEHLDAGASPAAVYALRVDSHGEIPSGAGFPVAATQHDQIPMGLASDGAGGAYAVWGEYRHDASSMDLYAQRFAGDGTLAPAWPDSGLLVCGAPAGQDQATIALSGSSPYVVWRDFRRTATDSTAGSDVFAARLTADGTVPALLALVEATATRAGVRLRWQAATGPGFARVRRSADGVEWTDIGETPRDGGGYYEFFDGAVAAGALLAYRLASVPGEPLSAVAWVRVPAGTRLALAGLMPAAGLPTIALALATDAPARRDIFDVQGRRLEALDLSGRGAGEHVVLCPVDLPAGIYMLRLTQGEATVARWSVRLK